MIAIKEQVQKMSDNTPQIGPATKKPEAMKYYLNRKPATNKTL